MPVETTASAPRAQKPQPAEGSIKETVESILVAFVLAFIFRAFVVEAFVIPTGSMAPTLLGAHMRYHCTDCGYEWDVNFSAGNGPRDDDRIPSVATGYRFDQPPRQIRCPNCGNPVAPIDLHDPNNDAVDPLIHYGDRILVLKYAYLPWFGGPARWDVVVFKSPHEEAVDPTQLRFSQNYIKRLIGKPNERVMILDGDIYIGHSGDQPRDFKIQRKPRVVQEALWRNVYDNDYLPHLDRSIPPPGLTPLEQDEYRRRVKPWVQPWQAVHGGSGWDLHPGTQAARIFNFANPAGAGELQFNPNAIPDTYPLTDWLAYDQVQEQDQPRTHMPSVTDLKLSMYYRRSEGDGPLTLKMTKGDDVFAIHLSAGAAELTRKTGDDDEVVLQRDASVPELHRGEPIELEFQNVDYRASLRLNGRDVLSADYEPDIQHLLATGRSPQPAPQVTIVAERQTCTIEHLHLSRDIYYLNAWTMSNAPLASPDNIMNLGDDEYFVLGDNSLISGDARTWTSVNRDEVYLPDEDLYSAKGRVPGRFLLGKAFFVYWPAGYRPWTKAPFGIVPNFGDMRFIH